jgi:hypothetical protein
MYPQNESLSSTSCAGPERCYRTRRAGRVLEGSPGADQAGPEKLKIFSKVFFFFRGKGNLDVLMPSRRYKKDFYCTAGVTVFSLAIGQTLQKLFFVSFYDDDISPSLPRSLNIL